MANGDQNALLNWDDDSIKTSAEYGDDGAGTSRWHFWARIANGGNATQGAIADAAVTDPAASATVVGVLKGILSRLNVGSTGMLKAEDGAATSGDYGVMALAVRRDAPTSDAAANDYHALHVDALGRLRIVGTHPEDGAHASGDYGSFVLGVANTTKTAFSAAGDYTPISTGLAGENFISEVPEASAAWALSNYTVMSATSGVIKASPGKLYEIIITNDNAGSRWIQFFNSITVPADGAVPVISIKLAAGQSMQFDWRMGRYFSTGICWANSTTGPTKTLGSADLEIDAQYL